MKQTLWLTVTLTCLHGGFFAFGDEPATLEGTIIDKATGQLTCATVSIIDARNNLVTESRSFQGGFRCPGRFSKQLPSGKTRIRVTRGFETQFLEQEIDLAAGQSRTVKFELSRHVDLRKRGWYAGDSHVHMLHGERNVAVSFDDVALAARAEDLQYLSLAQAWQLEDPTPENLEAQLKPRSTPDCTLTWNLEAPKNYYLGDAGRCLGHCWNLGLRGRTKGGLDVIHVLMEASAWDYEIQKPTYGNFESHRLIHRQGGAVFYTHPARWWMGAWGGQSGYPKVERMRVSNMAVELPLDTVLGPTFDGLDVITGPGEFEGNEKAFALWILLLNHGYRLAATGSSDACFDRPGGAVPGVPRTYTFLPNGFSLEKVTRATAAGRTFVTTGPLLLATVDGSPPGSAFNGDGQVHQLAIEAWACGEDQDGIHKVQVLRNGEPLKEWSLEEHPVYFRTNMTFQQADAGWFCVRVKQGDASHRQAISGAFYFGPRRPPPVARSRIHISLVDAQSNLPIHGTVTEVQYYGTIPHPGKRRTVSQAGRVLEVPGGVRLRAEAPGYTSRTLSPVFDNSALVNWMTHLSEDDLLKWGTFEKMRTELAQMNLKFRLERLPR